MGFVGTFEPCDLVTILQRPIFNLLHKIIQFSNIMLYSDSFFRDPKCHWNSTILYWVCTCAIVTRSLLKTSLDQNLQIFHLQSIVLLKRIFVIKRENNVLGSSLIWTCWILNIEYLFSAGRRSGNNKYSKFKIQNSTHPNQYES